MKNRGQLDIIWELLPLLAEGRALTTACAMIGISGLQQKKYGRFLRKHRILTEKPTSLTEKGQAFLKLLDDFMPLVNEYLGKEEV